MNIFFICEDTQILDIIKQEIENKYEFVTTTFLSKATKITKEFSITIGLYNNENKAKFNYRDYDHLFKWEYINGELKGKGDLFSVDLIYYLHFLMEKYSKLSFVLKNIQEGRFHIYFKEYFFGGGRGDEHSFEIKEKGKEIGSFVLENNDIRVHLVDGSMYWLDDTNTNPNKPIICLIKDIIGKALIRDDREYASEFNDGENVFLPCGYDDVTREDFFDNKNEYFSNYSFPFAKL